MNHYQATLKRPSSLSKLDCWPHCVTFWGSIGYTGRLVARCCWHICVTLLEIWEKCGLTFQVHWKHPGPVSNHSWCGNTIPCALIWYNLVFGFSEPRTHKLVHMTNCNRRSKKHAFNSLLREISLEEAQSCLFLNPDGLIMFWLYLYVPLAYFTCQLGIITCEKRTSHCSDSSCLLAFDSWLAFHYIVRIRVTAGRQI